MGVGLWAQSAREELRAMQQTQAQLARQGQLARESAVPPEEQGLEAVERVVSPLTNGGQRRVG